MIKQRLLLGAHMSISGGFDKAIVRGESIGCTTIQVFTKSNRQWYARPLTDEEIETFKNTAKQGSINPIVAHCSYLLNIGAADKTTHEKSVKSFAEELHRCQQLEIPYLVIHPGSCGKSSEKECLKKIAATLDETFSKLPGKTMVLLETMAGQGSNLGYQFEHLAELYRLSEHKKQIGICLDTCHIFAAGYKFDTQEHYENVWNQFDNIIGLNLLKVIHLNDSKKELGSRVDRHEDIGKGKIGLESFKMIMNDKRFFDIPKIIETPKEDLNDDLRNMKTLVQLISKENQKKLVINDMLKKK